MNVTSHLKQNFQTLVEKLPLPLLSLAEELAGQLGEYMIDELRRIHLILQQVNPLTSNTIATPSTGRIYNS